MKLLLKIEYVFLLALGFFAYSETGRSWWIFLAFFFAPDISMLGYLINSKMGAYAYNFFHHFAIAIAAYIIGKIFLLGWLEVSGIILFSHISFDRIFGYGLKHTDGFHNTHLGIIGKNKI